MGKLMIAAALALLLLAQPANPARAGAVAPPISRLASLSFLNLPL